MTQPTEALKLPFEPYSHQREAHAKRKRFTVLVWHRRGGKTVFAVLELILAALACPRPRGRYAYIAPLLKQAKGVAWDYVKAYTAGIPGIIVHENDLSVTLPNGAQIRLFGADNPDALRGFYFDGAVLDEVADMKPAFWGLVVRPALADRQGWALFIGTPKGINLFSELYYSAQNDPEWHADLRRAADTGVIPASEIEQARRGMAPSQFAQEFECDFAAAVANALIPLDVALDAQRRSVRPEALKYAPKIMGVDVARYGDDYNAIAQRQGQVLYPIKKFRGLDLMTVAGMVARAAAEWGPDVIFVDVGGLGAGVVDRLRQLGWSVIEVNFGSASSDERYSRKRTQMWALMADWLKTASLPPDDQELVGQLVAPTYTWANANGKMELESKDDMRARGLPSPDLADALACTFAQPVPMRNAPGLRDAAPALMAVIEFDPYAA